MEKELPILNSVEQRVLGSLIEKSRSTPDYYPMSLNAVTAACNQKTSRDPVVSYSEEEVQKALYSLKSISLVSTAVGGGSRTLKYKHNITTVFPMHDGQLAALCILLLRGPQTAGEINTNSGKVYEFNSLEAVLETLESLIQKETPFVKELNRKPGQKESRYIHLFGAFTEESVADTTVSVSSVKNNDLEERVLQLEKEVFDLKLIIEKLEQRIG